MRISLLLFSCFLFCTSNGFAQNAEIHLSVSGYENEKGYIRVGLFTNNKDFPIIGNELTHAIAKPDIKGITQIEIKNIKEGEYAIALWHDENNNKKFDRNSIGKPKEKYGFSKNVFGFIGPPKFGKASFILTNNEQVKFEIKLK